MMKKNAVFLLVLVMTVLLSSCSSRIVAGEPVRFEDLQAQKQDDIADYKSFTHLSEINGPNLDTKIIIRGKKEGMSTPMTLLNDEGGVWENYCETKVKVSEAYYGDVKAGDVITLKESVRVKEVEGERYIFYPENTPPLAEGEEYILILFNLGKTSKDGGKLYTTISQHHSYHKISDYASYAQKVKEGTATQRENFGFEVMDYYLNHPDTRLDFKAEAAALAKENGQESSDRFSVAASREDQLASLTKEQQALLERMVAQYGER